MNFRQTILSISMVIATTACLQQAVKNEWAITYRKVDVFIGNCKIKISTDSCYYESTFSYNRKPIIVSWKSSRQKLSELYKKIVAFNLEQCSPIRAAITEEPFETMELIQNDRVVFSIQREQQTATDVIKFDSVVAILKSFSSEAQGWKY